MFVEIMLMKPLSKNKKKQEYEELIQQLKEDEKLIQDPILAQEFIIRFKNYFINKQFP